MNVIIDYGLGNIRSIENWFKRGDIKTIVSRDKDIIREADFLILPGVGAYRDAMKALTSYGLDILIKEHVKKNKPIIGICLGMQLLYEVSLENGHYEGLGILSGEVVPFKSKSLKIPHMGWNTITLKNSSKYFKNINNDYVYYVHSYYVKSKGEEVLFDSEYGDLITGIVKKENVIGFQFHPEKSGDTGIKILEGIKEFINDYISSN